MLIGLVGKPSSGKSSMFKAMTMKDVKISGVPFTTIEPNVGVGYAISDCVCGEMEVKCNPKYGFCRNGKRFIPVKIIDVAGLVPGAHEGRGLGNQFLDDLRQASVLVHIVDATGETDSEGNPGQGNPEKDIEFLENEINLWFSTVIEKALVKFERQISNATKSSTADLADILWKQLTGLQIEKSDIEKALKKVKLDLKDKDSIMEFADEIRILSKPILVAANKIDLSKAQENYEVLKEKVGNIIPTSAEAEIALKKAHESGIIDYLPGNSFTTNGNVKEEQRKALDFIKMRILGKYGSTGVQDCINKAVFDLLEYIVVYPVANANKMTDKDGNVLPDAMLIPKGTTTKELAYLIHTDIGEKFICGVDVRTKRKIASDYELNNNDIVEIMTSK